MTLSRFFRSACLGLILGVLLTPGANAQRIELHEVWSLSPGDRDYITTTDRQRGLAVHPTEGYVLLVHRPGAGEAPVIPILDGLTGQEIGRLSVAGVEVGHANDFLLSKIAISEDGAIYASNLKVNDANNYRIYRWADKDADPELIYDGQLNSTDPVTQNRRFGDSLAVRGAGMDAEILLSTWFGGVWARLTPLPPEEVTDPNNKFAAEVFGLTDIANAEVRDITWGPGALVYGSRVTKAMYEVDYQPSEPSATRVRSFDSAILPAGLGPVGSELTQGWLGAVDVASHRFYLFDMADLTTEFTVQPIASRLFPTLNTNGNGVGAVAFGNGLIYALDTNNGVMAMELVEVQPAPVQPGEVLWTAADAVMGVQRNGDNLRTHASGFSRAIGIAADDGAQRVYFADDAGGTIGRFRYDGTNLEDLMWRSGLQFLALSGGRVFWTEYTTGLWSAALDGSDEQQLMNISGNATAGLVIDESAGKVYVASAGAGAELYRSNLDGSEFETVSNIALASGTYGLALDSAQGILYASNYAAGGTIVAYDLETGAAETLYSARPYPLGLAVSEDGSRLFWAERNVPAQQSTTGRILTAPATAGGQVRELASGLNSPFGVALVPQSLSPFEEWLAQFELPAGQRGPGDDPDGDGITNLMEYALEGGDPAAPDTSILSAPALVTDGGESYLALAVTLNGSGQGLDFIIEVSADLVTWNSGEGHTTVIPSATTVLAVRDNVPVTAATRRFIRFRVKEQ